MVDANQIKEHMEVKAADGQHVGTVDHMQGGDQIKLTKTDPGHMAVIIISSRSPGSITSTRMFTSASRAKR